MTERLATDRAEATYCPDEAHGMSATYRPRDAVDVLLLAVVVAAAVAALVIAAVLLAGRGHEQQRPAPHRAQYALDLTTPLAPPASAPPVAA